MGKLSVVQVGYTVSLEITGILYESAPNNLHSVPMREVVRSLYCEARGKGVEVGMVDGCGTFGFYARDQSSCHITDLQLIFTILLTITMIFP